MITVKTYAVAIKAIGAMHIHSSCQPIGGSKDAIVSIVVALLST